MPGQKLPERALAAKWGVSPSPVREALGRLEAVGLLERQGRGRSLYVKDIDEGEIVEIMQARAVLEGFAGREACGKLTEAELNELERLCGEIERMQEAGQTLENEPLEIQFHNLILKAAGNRYIEGLVEDARMTMYSSTLARLVSLIGVDRPRENDPPNHYDIVESLRSRDPQRAEAVAREHILVAMRRLLQDAKKAREILSLRLPAPRKEVLSHELGVMSCGFAPG